MANHVHKKTGMKNLCLGGGVALNGVANYRILKEGHFENLHIPPSPGDGGSAIGCAQYLYYCHKKNKRKIEHNVESIKNNVFVGPSYSNDEIKSFLDINKIDYKFSLKEVYISKNNYRCIFFNMDKKQCDIYEVRPTQCKTYPFWDRFKKYKSEVIKECPAIVLE